MQILDGNSASQHIRNQLKEETAQWVAQGNRPPHLTAILVGTDGASQTYVASKARDCAYIGFGSEVIRLPEHTTEEALLHRIHQINVSDHTDGLIVQLPLPKHISEQKVTDSISPLKDVDGFTPANFGKVARGEGGYIPATPFGILKLLEHYQIQTQGKHCVVVGRSNIVGRPMSILLSQGGPYGDATVTLCHRKTPDLAYFTRQADILIVAVGIPGLIQAQHLKPGAVVVDVGITRVNNPSTAKGYELKGDVDFSAVVEHCAAITPVPGGVGPMTRVGLMINTMHAYKQRFHDTKP